MASLLGLQTASAYYKKERGEIKISVSEAQKIAARLNSHVDDLFFDFKSSK